MMETERKKNDYWEERLRETKVAQSCCKEKVDGK